MIYINEWLPNPTGADAAGEWTELYNSDSTSVNLAGWTLQTKSGKSISLSGHQISGNGYLVLPRTETKLALKNTDEALYLFDSQGKLVDQSVIPGTAQEGKSWSRFSYNESGNFGFADPTPAAANAKANTALIVHQYPLNTSLNSATLGGFEVAGIALSSAAFLAALILYACIHYDYLQELFFHRN